SSEPPHRRARCTTLPCPPSCHSFVLGSKTYKPPCCRQYANPGAGWRTAQPAAVPGGVGQESGEACLTQTPRVSVGPPRAFCFSSGAVGYPGRGCLGRIG